MPNWVSKISVLDNIYLVLILAATCILLLRYSVLASNLKVLLLFTAVHFLTETLSLYIHYGLGQQNNPVYHFFAYTGYIILAFFFYRTFQTSLARWAVLISIPVYLALSFVYLLVWEPITEYCSLALMTNHFFMICCCFVFYRHILNFKEPYRPEKDRTFWIVTGLLFYFVGNFFIVSSYNYIRTHRPALLTDMYYAGYIFNYLLYVMIIITGLIHFQTDTHE